MPRNLDWIKLAGAGNKIHPTYAVLGIICLFSSVVIIPLVLGVRYKIVFLVLICYCVLHTWLAEYWKLVAKKEAILMKHEQSAKQCRLDKRGFAGSLTDFFSGLWNGVDDPCEEYYKAAMVDPALEVNLIHALVESSSQLMGVLGGLGKALGQFVTNLLAPLPLVWKGPVLVIGTILTVVLFLLIFGCKFSTFFFSITPAQEIERPKRLKSSSRTKKLTTSGNSRSAVDCDLDESYSSCSDDQRQLRQHDKAVKQRKQLLPYPSDDTGNYKLPVDVDNRPTYRP